MTDDAAADALFAGVYGHLKQRLANLIASKSKLVHYTTAANALNIIKGKTVWLRNAALMNDFSEISLGKRFLVDALGAKAEELRSALEPFHPGLADEVLQNLVAVDYAVQNQTYLISLAEHGADDSVGKLSMWRAYGGPIAGVALVFDIDPGDDEAAEDVNAFLLPVHYGYEEWSAAFAGIFEYLPTCAEVLTALSRGRAHRILFNIFHDLILTAKHPAFKEEQEWRLIHSPYEFSSNWVRPHVEAVNGIPQIVHKLSLSDHEGANTPKLSLDNILHRLLIGPCQYPEQVAHAFVVALEEAGVKAPRERVRYSAIPLRQQS